MDINIIDDNLMYKFLDNLEYDKLDYSHIINLHYLYIYIEYKIVFGYDDYYNKLDILEKQSLICYYSILSRFNDKYNDMLLLLEPSNIIEKIQYKAILKKNKLQSHDINIKNNIIDEINNYIDDLTKDNIMINNYYKNKILFKNNICNFKPNNQQIYYTTLFFVHKIHMLDYKTNILCLEILKNNTIINKYYLDYLEVYINFLINNKVDIDVMLDYNNRIYNNIHNYKYIYLKNKYGVINNIVFSINRLINNVNREIFIKKIKTIYESYKIDDNISDDLLSLEIFINIEYIMYSVISNYENDKNKKQEYYNLSINSILRTKNINNHPNKISDLMILYYISNNYNKVLEYYDKYKEFFIDRYKNEAIVIKVYCIVIESYINTHKIQSVNDLYSIINQIDYNEIFKHSFEWINKTKKRLIFMKNIISTPLLNYNIIENYDLVSDTKCLRDTDNKIICPICLENVEQDKITLIECNKCNKYVGHMLCVYNFIISNLMD
jgi:hypothetical protein